MALDFSWLSLQPTLPHPRLTRKTQNRPNRDGDHKAPGAIVDAQDGPKQRSRMSTHVRSSRITRIGRCTVSAKGAVMVALSLMLTVVDASAQLCPGTTVTVTSGLRRPMGMALSNQGNVLVSETGTATPHSGRISIVDPSGDRRTLLDGLPSGRSDVGDPAGPAGIAMRGRTLYALMSIGDSVLASPVPTRNLANPNVSSPIFSSVLAIHFSAHVEKTTAGFTLSPADEQTLAAGQSVHLSNGGGDTVDIELVANFPDYVSDPLPGFPAIVRGSNPFGLVVVADQIYVTDGGRNLVWQVDIPTGSFSPLATFPTIPNPLSPAVGGPVVEAVPTGIEYADGELLVTLFRGVPFAPGTSAVVRIDPSTGVQSPFLSGLKTAIGVLGIKDGGEESYLVLQNSSGLAPFFAGPGLVLKFDSPGGAPTVLTDCLARPTAMLRDAKTGTLYITELLTGRIVALHFGS